MKQRLTLLRVLFILIVVFGFSSISNAKEYPSMKLKVTSMAPKGTFSNAIIEWFVEGIEKGTGGKVTFDKYWAGALLKGVEQLEGAQHGVTDIAFVCPGYTPGKLPVAFSIFAFPFCPTNTSMMSSIWLQLYNEFPWMHKELTAHNIKFLSLWTSSDYGILSKSPITNLQDLEGKKIVQLGGYFADWTKAAGIMPVSGVPAAERYERLRTGVVDGSLLIPHVFLAFKEYEVAKNLIMTGLGARPAVYIVINLDTWKKLPKDLQSLMIDVGKEVGKRFSDATEAETKKAIEFLKANGVAYHGSLSDKDLKRWASRVPDTTAKMCRSLEAKYPEIWDMSHRLIELAEQNGHKWPLKLGVK